MGAAKFSSFIILAEMRTGSNFLEQNINQFPDLQSYGELFNPHFIGGAKKDELLGITLTAREKAPFELLHAIRAAHGEGIPGFRFFHDHDPRVLQKCLDDPACGKVILTRNPLDSYVSRQIAGVTGQWKLTNIKHQKTARIEFDPVEFSTHLETTQAFQIKVLRLLQTSGQTAFYISYDDLHSLDVLNGLARFLGSEHQIEGLDRELKIQNPASLQDKVSNYSEMVTELGKIDFMGLGKTPNFEPRRGAGVPQFVLGNRTPVVFLPIMGAPVDAVKGWLAAQDGAQQGELLAGLNQKELRIWRQEHPGFKTISVLRHPVLRAYLGFCDVILASDQGKYRDLRQKVIKQFKIKVPKEGTDPDQAAHKAAFLAFLRFLKLNLSNQTSLRIDPIWASQTATLAGAAGVLMPGNIIHEADLAPGIAYLENVLGLPPIAVTKEDTTRKIDLADIYDANIEARIRDIYARDYLNFGFLAWEPQGKAEKP